MGKMAERKTGVLGLPWPAGLARLVLALILVGGMALKANDGAGDHGGSGGTGGGSGSGGTPGILSPSAGQIYAVGQAISFHAAADGRTPTWTFDDGTTFTGLSTSRSFSSLGQHSVSLRYPAIPNGREDLGEPAVYCGCSFTITGQPQITGFAASPGTVYTGGAATLSWSISGTGLTCSLAPGIGTVSGSSATVSPTGTTTYTLTATNVAGTASSQCTVVVYPAPGQPTLSATPATINQGQSTTLTWSTVGNGLTFSLAPDVGPVTGTSLSVKPATTTTYTLTATNPAGSTTASCTVVVNLPPVLPAVATVSWQQGRATNLALPTATDPGGRPLTYSVSGLPGALAFNADSRTVSGALLTQGTYRFTYIATNNLGLATSVPVAITVGPRALTTLAATSTIQYAYDDSGRLATLTYPSGSQVTYTYDTLDRVTAVARNGQAIVREVDYDAWSNRHQTIWRSGAVDQWAYDAFGTRETQWTIGTVGGSPQARTYQYDGVGRLIQAGEWSSLGYDADSRLTSAVGFGITTALAHDSYMNNISSASTGTVPSAMTNFTFNPEVDNHLPGQAANGALTDVVWTPYGEIQQVGTGISTNVDLNLAWDDLGRLAAVEAPQGTWRSVESYAYDAAGLRVTRIDSVNPGLNRIYAYTQAGELLTECLGNGSQVWNRDVVYLGTVAVAEVDAAGNVHELHTDHQGTPRVSTGASGAVEGTQAFAPYGETLDGFTQGTYMPLTGFTGHLQIEPNGLIYMRGRFYSPAWHVFLNSDQGADPNQLNQLAYVGGSPLMHTDPTGMYDPDAGFSERHLNNSSFREQTAREKMHDFRERIKNFMKGWGFINDAEIHWKINDMFAKDPIGTAMKLAMKHGMKETEAMCLGMMACGLSPTSPALNPAAFAGKTPEQINKMAIENGLVPKGVNPKIGQGSYVDPVTGKQRVLIHPEGENPHMHVNDPLGNRLNIDGDHVPSESDDAHLPLGGY